MSRCVLAPSRSRSYPALTTTAPRGMPEPGLGWVVHSRVQTLTVTTMSIAFVCKANCYFYRSITEFCLIFRLQELATVCCHVWVYIHNADAFCKELLQHYNFHSFYCCVWSGSEIMITSSNILSNLSEIWITLSVQCQLRPGTQAAQCDLPQWKRPIVSKDTMLRRKGESIVSDKSHYKKN